ncbi:uncharacterized protein N7483_005875 [Penicillium malachiteum]|uniref:uncharacterized protein n=1 Tax=Penicillium malachiteum TaxID=1324776 RepID=UPI002546D902|nr:uncharacterized protein N7483_005875 [Penicillium malachiteum]KAJ5731367.1 hypothetical protein N7483_005875 [Penicillium malachiteum]
MVLTWARCWCFPKLEALSHITEDQKNAIMQRLEHCCFESTWDGLLARLTPLQAEKIASVIMECFLWNAVVSLYEENQFWFIDGGFSPEDDQGQESFTRGLNHLYERFYSTNPIEAAYWRSETWQLAIPCSWAQASDRTLETSENQRQKELLKSFIVIDEFLTQDIFIHRGHVQFRWKRGVPERFHSRDQFQEAHYLHGWIHDFQEGQHDGYPVILVVIPEIVVTWNGIWKSTFKELTYCESLVLLEDTNAHEMSTLVDPSGDYHKLVDELNDV